MLPLPDIENRNSSNNSSAHTIIVLQHKINRTEARKMSNVNPVRGSTNSLRTCNGNKYIWVYNWHSHDYTNTTKHTYWIALLQRNQSEHMPRMHSTTAEASMVSRVPFWQASSWLYIVPARVRKELSSNTRNGKQCCACATAGLGVCSSRKYLTVNETVFNGRQDFFFGVEKKNNRFLKEKAKTGWKP